MGHRVLLAAWVVLLLFAAGPVGARQQVAMPHARKIVVLVRNSLLTLNGALQTGNDAVLRDQGAPEFREANGAGRLARIFSDLAARTVDLSAVAVISPELTEAPGLDKPNDMLHLKGHFPGEPFPINFELLYRAVNGNWRLFGISVNPGKAAAAEAKAPNTISVEKN